MNLLFVSTVRLPHQTVDGFYYSDDLQEKIRGDADHFASRNTKSDCTEAQSPSQQAEELTDLSAMGIITVLEQDRQLLLTTAMPARQQALGQGHPAADDLLQRLQKLALICTAAARFELSF